MHDELGEAKETITHLEQELNRAQDELEMH